MNAQFITTPNGEELAILPKVEFDALVRAAQEAIEDAADVAAFDAAIADIDGTAALPAVVSANILAGVGRLRAIRVWKLKRQKAVAETAGISQGFLSDLENGNRALTDDVKTRLAKALEVPLNWL